LVTGTDWYFSVLSTTPLFEVIVELWFHKLHSPIARASGHVKTAESPRLQTQRRRVTEIARMRLPPPEGTRRSLHRRSSSPRPSWTGQAARYTAAAWDSGRNA